MNSFSELVRSRRSIRSYMDLEIEQKKLEECVEAARHSPSACNSQPWKFIIVNDAAIKEKIKNTVFSGPYSMNSFASGAASYIVIISEKTKLPARIAGYLMHANFRQIDLGIACSHIVLQAQELGIVSCILGWFDQRAVRRILRVPRSVRIELIIALGYNNQKSLPEKKYKNRNEVISHNRY